MPLDATFKEYKFNNTVTTILLASFFTTRLYASAAYAVIVSVCLYVRLSQVCIQQPGRSGVFQGLTEPNRAWLLDNRSLTPVASGRPLVYQVTQIIPYKEVGGVAR